MTFSVSLSVAARDDFRRAQEYYDAAARGAARRVSMRVFPYQVWYRVRADAEVIEVIAVLHHRRDLELVGERLDAQD